MTDNQLEYAREDIKFWNLVLKLELERVIERLEYLENRPFLWGRHKIEIISLKKKKRRLMKQVRV